MCPNAGNTFSNLTAFEEGDCNGFLLKFQKSKVMVWFNSKQMMEEGLPAKASDSTLELFPLHHTTMQLARQNKSSDHTPSSTRCSQWREASFLANWTGRRPDSHPVLKWMVSTKYFLLGKRFFNSRRFFQTVNLFNLLLIEEHFASGSGAGNRDLVFRLALLRINFLFSAKGYLPHFVLSIIHGCTC